MAAEASRQTPRCPTSDPVPAGLAGVWSYENINWTSSLGLRMVSLAPLPCTEGADSGPHQAMSADGPAKRVNKQILEAWGEEAGQKVLKAESFKDVMVDSIRLCLSDTDSDNSAASQYV